MNPPIRTRRRRPPGRMATMLVAIALGGAAGGAWAAGPLLTLDASARQSVPNDEMQVTLAVEREGASLGEMNEAVLSQLDAALSEAKATEGVRARLGGVTTLRNYSRDGKPAGWRVRGEAVLESDRQRALAQLAGRLAERMQVASVQFRLSDARRREEERRLLAQAAANFRQRAADAAKAFGFADYDIREMALDGAARPVPPRPLRAMSEAGGPAARAMAAPVPSEGGESDVTVVVNGTVELK